MDCQGAKPKILLVWGYYRIGWIEPFLALKEDFDFHFLNFLTKQQDTAQDFEFPCHYWTEYKSAQALLHTVKPDAIVFMGLVTTLPISLNMAARKLGVPTFIMQHGLYSNLATYLALEKKNPTFQRQGTADQNKAAGKVPRFFALRFFLRSFHPANTFQYLAFFRYLLKVRKMGIHHGMSVAHFEGRFPDKYIGFTHFNMRSIYERDGISKERVILIGNPYYDIYNKQICERSPSEAYFLLIDQPLAENRFVNYGVSKEEVNAFYSKLNTYAKGQGARLVVKLHPENYKSTFMLSDDNITYVKEADLAELILEAAGCFGCPSTLMIPCLYYKPSVLFRTPNLEDPDNNFEQFGIAQVLDYHSFEPEQIRFVEKNPHSEGARAFESRYFLVADGQSTSRLATVFRQAKEFARSIEPVSLLEKSDGNR
jgi:hypothetical protein